MGCCSESVVRLPKGGRKGPQGPTGEPGITGLAGGTGLQGVAGGISIYQPLKFVKEFYRTSGTSTLTILRSELSVAGLLKDMVVGNPLPHSFKIRIYYKDDFTNNNWFSLERDALNDSGGTNTVLNSVQDVITDVKISVYNLNTVLYRVVIIG